MNSTHVDGNRVSMNKHGLSSLPVAMVGKNRHSVRVIMVVVDDGVGL